MRAHVVKRANHAVLAPDDDRRRTGSLDPLDLVVPGLGNFAGAADAEPDLAENLFLLLLVPGGEM
jgi:hypothetical protein